MIFLKRRIFSSAFLVLQLNFLEGSILTPAYLEQTVLEKTAHEEASMLVPIESQENPELDILEETLRATHLLQQFA